MNEQFTSQASNFVDGLQTQVDPRTGQFMIRLPLAALVGNRQLGPDLVLGLNYSPLDTENYGFGQGFNLGLTHFSNKTNLLELSNGERYRVIPGTDQVRNKKLANFIFAYANGVDDSEGYIVRWKEGKHERLTLCGDHHFVTSAIASPLGRSLELGWDFGGKWPLLKTIKDEFVTLCEIIYDTNTTITVWPGSEESYTIDLLIINSKFLDRVERRVSNEIRLSWDFDYESVQGAPDLLVTGVKYPTGLSERVAYNYVKGLQYPVKSGRGRLPAVLSHIRSFGAGQPEATTYYDYSVQNFLGYNGNFGDWAADSDYLYTTLTDYTYSSTQTLSDTTATITTVRTYNNYHLQVSEEIIREGCTYRTDFAYYAEEGKFIDSQPPQFQLIREKKDTWTDAQGKSRTQTTLSEFDEYGNPLRQVAPDGTETVFLWYAAAGEDGCPAEPNGFVRFVKERLTVPRETAYDAPRMSTRYTYATLGTCGGVVQSTMESYADAVLLQKRRFTYVEDSDDGECGRITSISDTKYDDGQAGAAFTSRRDFATTVADGLMTQKVTWTGHDGIRTAVERTQSAFSALLLRETDAQGVTITHAWDQLGRPLRQTIAPDTEYENTTTWSYAIEGGSPVTTETDASGNQLKTFFDGAGRDIRQQRFDKDGTGTWYEIASRTYNAAGEVVSGSSCDWIAGSSEQYRVDMTAAYDGWGGTNTQGFSDGTKNVKDDDPVALRRVVFSQGMIDSTTLDSGMRITSFDDLSRLPITESLKDVSGVEQGLRRYEWDGQGRLRKETDELGNVTERTYDVYGRVLTQTIPDGSVVSRTYAPHLAGDQVASISVTGTAGDGTVQTWLLGTQKFDSLGRVTESVSGGRTTTCRYDGISAVPSAVILPSGKTLEYRCIAELGDVVSSAAADGALQTFRYDSSTGDLLTAGEGTAEISHSFHPSGALKEEAFTLNGDTCHAAYAHTLSGELVSYTDITGAQTKCELDNHGRLTAVIDDVMAVRFQYDALGRLSAQTAEDAATRATLTCTLGYDDFEREVVRTIADSSGDTLTVSTTWLQNGLLASRRTERNGSLVTDERYGYDVRNRAVSFDVSGSKLPVDAYGHEMVAQTFSHDALNNLTSVTTTLADGTHDTATHRYENTSDPTQLTSVTHTHNDYPQTISLEYDADGRMTRDDAGRTLSYDATGRLVSVSVEGASGGRYGYDALNRLASRTVGDTDTRQFYYRADELVNEVLSAQNRTMRLIKAGHNCLGVSDGSSLTLTAGDQHDSLLWSRDGSQDEGRQHAWSPYGSGDPSDQLPGFNGERVDPITGTYHLGNGYRAYNPVLMRFNCPDSLSPFGGGGINPYAYCAGDPINHTDPSGHMSWQGITGIVTGVLGVALSIFTAGASIAAAGGVMAALSATSATSLTLGGLALVADATAIASGAAEDSDPRASSILGWVSMATGLAGLGAALGQGGRAAARRFRASSDKQRRWGITEVDQKILDPGTLDERIDLSGYTNNWRGTGEEGLILHGTKQGKLWVGGVVREHGAVDRAINDRIFYYEKIPSTIRPGHLNGHLQRKHRIDLRLGHGPVHLDSCYAKRGAAQLLADSIDRPVIAYSKHTVASAGIHAAESPRFLVWADFRKHDVRRLFVPFHKPSPRIYYPKGGADAARTGERWSLNINYPRPPR